MKISVIVPVYNVERYIGECLDSLEKQTYTDIEIICVNDGSPDGSRSIVARYAEKDTRIRIIDQPNKGLSGARNAGIAAATGDVLCFVDSDDVVEPDHCERIAIEFKRDEVNAVVFGATCFPAQAAPRWDVEHLSPRQAWYPSFAPSLLFEEMSTPYAWRVALRRSALEGSGVLFDEGLRYGEDQLFLFSLYPRISGVQLIPDKLYRYRMAREGSLTADSVRQAKDPARAVADNIAIAERIFQNWTEGGLLPAYAKELVNWSVQFVGYGAMCQVPEARDSLCARIKRMWNGSVGTNAVASLNLEPHVRPMARAIESFTDEGTRTLQENDLRAIARRYRVKEYGVADLARTVFEKLLGKRK